MKSEEAPVTDDEIVLRLVWRNFYVPGDPLKVKPRAFHPRDDETTGISVFRSACLHQPSDALLALPKVENRPFYLIVGILVSDLRQLGITFTPDQIPAVSGHALLIELNSNSWASDKATWLPRVEKLAELAVIAVVHVPADSR